MKKILSLLVFMQLCFNLKSQILSGNCTEAFTASIGYNPSSDGYLPSSISTASIYSGFSAASGDYKIFPATGNACNSLSKVIIIIEGYDQDNLFDVNDIYNFFSTAGGILRNQGYDIITLNFSNSLDYMERNAFLLVELINRVNNSKTGNNEVSIIGASMGGIVARQALSYMEANNLSHQVGALVTFDSPNKGANFPLGIQALLLAYHNSPITTAFVNPQWDISGSPSTTQLLRNLWVGSQGPNNLSPNMVKFYNKLRNLNGCFGYPKNCKNYAVTLGATNGQGQLKNDGTPMISNGLAFQFVGPLQAGQVATAPTNPPCSASSCTVCYNGGFFINSIHNMSPYLPLDIAPGGYTEAFKLTADATASFPIGSTTLTKICDNATFIPTISSIDYKETDLFYNIDNDIINGISATKTPFDEFYASNSSSNTEHIAFIPFSTQNWIINKITASSVNNVCGNFDFTITNANYNSSLNYFGKAQNNINLDNLSVSNKKFQVYSGNQISLTNEVGITSGSEFGAFIKSCNAAKSCGFVGSGLKVFNDQEKNLEFTAEGYDDYLERMKIEYPDFEKNIRRSEIKSEIINEYVIEPNPSNGIFTIKTELLNEKRVQVKNLLGETTLEFNTKEGKFVINIEHFPQGIYNLIIDSDNGKRVFKLIKND